MSITIDVDFDEIADDIRDKELIGELCDRLERGSIKKEHLQELLEVLPFAAGIVEFKVETLDDRIKVEHLNRVFDKYTAVQLETLIPEI